MKKHVSLILAAVMFFSLALYAQPEQGEMEMGRPHLKELLKLTPDQEKKIHELRYEHEKDAIDIRAKIQKNRLELRNMVAENNINESKIFQLTDENTKLEGDLKHSMVKHLLDVYKSLDDNQKAIFAKHFGELADGFMREKMMQRMKDHPMERPGMEMRESPNNF